MYGGFILVKNEGSNRYGMMGNAENAVASVSSEHPVMEYGCPVNWDKFDICPVIRVSVK